MVDASFDEHFMRMALREAEKAAADGETGTNAQYDTRIDRKSVV